MPGPERDITFERALALVRAWALRQPPEMVPVREAVGRLLAEDVPMRSDHPAFDNSAMDGVAVRSHDTPGRLTVRGESRAGAPARERLGAGEAARISTGAEIPEGADAVVPRERVDDEGHAVTVPEVAPGANVRRRGETARAGDVLLRTGTRVAAHHLGAIASAGHAAVVCRRRARAAVLVTGDEIVPVGEPLAAGEVWDVNGVALPPLLHAAGAEVVDVRGVADDRVATVAALERALEEADLVVTSGGVSVGDHDHVRPALEGLGVEEVFWGVGIRPGHPLYLGAREATRVLAVPGNPVAATVCLLVFGRPLLGCADVWTEVPLAAAYRPGTRRTDLIRCRVDAEGLHLHPARRQASHDVTSLAEATHIAAIPAGTEEWPAGRPVPAMPLPA